MRLLTTFFFLIVASTTAFACPSGIEPSIGWMLNASALVFRGQVVRESLVSDAQGVKEHVSDVQIERTYKGSTPTIVRVRWKEYDLCIRARLDRGAYGLFFLSPKGSEFELADEEFGRVTVSHWQDNSRTTDPSVALERDLRLAIQKDTGKQRISDVLLLSSLNRPIGTAELHALLPTQDGTLNRAVHLALLRLKDYSRLEASGALVEMPSSTTRGSSDPFEFSYLRLALTSSIARIDDRAKLPVLRRFSLSKDNNLRDAAAMALRHLHDPSNVRHLVRLLDDPWDEIRIQATYGLQEYLKPGLEGYGWVINSPYNGKKTTLQEAVERWKGWWQSEGKAKYG